MSQTTYPLGMPDELLKEVKDAAQETGLSVADVMRQAIKFGVPRVRRGLSREEDFAEIAAASWGPAPEILWDKLPKEA